MLQKASHYMKLTFLLRLYFEENKELRLMQYYVCIDLSTPHNEFIKSNSPLLIII